MQRGRSIFIDVQGNIPTVRADLVAGSCSRLRFLGSAHFLSLPWEFKQKRDTFAQFNLSCHGPYAIQEERNSDIAAGFDIQPAIASLFTILSGFRRGKSFVFARILDRSIPWPESQIPAPAGDLAYISSFPIDLGVSLYASGQLREVGE